ncbi:YetF domain-containing protein [Pedobacter panaciterrae]|uniref:YetF domain-containing protein n=1 Tax=Pedobacter panaciterrae TaxID=363849 RepID=A0ABU8NKL9_9SPHI
MLLSIDWSGFLIGKENWEFMIEISIRTLVMYFIILFGLRLLGKRGVRQLSVFELVVIISLGSAAGDPMFYKEIGLLVPVIIFAVIVGAYRLTTYLMAKSKKLDDLIEGKCVHLIKNGEFSIEEFGKEGLAYDEFFSELRQQSISHLGQVETAILETSGNISIYYYPDEEVKYGLPILPVLFELSMVKIQKAGKYACSYCGNVEELPVTSMHKCKKCQRKQWVKAINSRRIK